VQEIDEGRLQAIEVMAIGFHVVGVDVGDDRHHRQQIQERRIGLVGLDHDVVAAAQRALAPGAVERPPITKVGSSPASASTLATRLVVVVLPWVPAMAMPCLRRISSASISARGHDRNVLLAGGQHLGVVCLHRGGRHHRIGTGHVGARVADMGLDAQAASRCSVALSARSEPEIT
jgi:hypothetical protein